MANILDVKKRLAQRVRTRRREAKISQAALAERSGVSLGSIKRFEGCGEISLSSLLRIAVVLGYENDFDKLFTRKNYQSIDEVVAGSSFGTLKIPELSGSSKISTTSKLSKTLKIARSSRESKNTKTARRGGNNAK